MGKKFVYDKGVDVDKEEGINITYSVFFDGTQNNKTNTEIGETKRKKIQAKSIDSYKRFFSVKVDEFPEPPLKDVEDDAPIYYGGDLEEVVVTAIQEKGDSYENDYTNVARLFYSYRNEKNIHENIYVEGVGTTDNDKDDDLAVATGVFSTSVRGKSKIASDEVFNRVVKLFENNKSKSIKFIDTLTIDVYGFSRGATTARYFTHFMTQKAKKEIAKHYEYHDVSKPMGAVMDEFKDLEYNFKFLKNEKLTKLEKAALLPLATNKTRDQLIIIAAKLAKIVKTAYTTVEHEYFQERLRLKGIKVNHINIRFLGLFDTVSSYGLFHDNDVKDLGLDAVNKAKRTVHLAAADEYRKNFALTNIKNAGFRGIELTLPGVHCDVGGAYNAIEHEKTAFYITSVYDELGVAPSNILLGPLGSAIKEALETNSKKFKKNLIKKGWVKENQFEFVYKTWLGSGTKTVQSIVLLGIIQSIIKGLPNKLRYLYLKEINQKMLEGLQIGLPPFGVLYGHRLLSNKYTFIPLEMMADFSIEMGVPIDKSKFSSNEWVISPDLQPIKKALYKYKNKVANLRKEFEYKDREDQIDKLQRDDIIDDTIGAISDVFTTNKNKEYIKKVNKISYKDYLTDTEQLHYLRNNYLHWSAKSDNFGLDPITRSENFENKRKIYNG